MLYGVTDWFKARDGRCRMLIAANNIITNVVYIVYPVLVLFLLFTGNAGFLKVLLIPGISFVLVTLLRKKINAPRPYQVYGISPIIPKETLGNSFPSRHAFSVFVIAMSAMYVDVILGSVMLLMGVALCFIRVIGGVHFIKDVAFGAFLGVFAGIFILI